MRVFFLYFMVYLMFMPAYTSFGSDETKFVSKNYSGSGFKEKAYKPKIYSSNKSSHIKAYKKKPEKKGFWSFLTKSKRAKHKEMTDTKSAPVKKFSRPDNSTARSESFDREKPVDNESFESNTGKTPDKEFIPDNRPRPKNPLLKPWQGVKAPLK